jgi:hypothetical protein
MSIAHGKPWVAVGLQGGLVYVVDAAKGAVLGSVDGQGFSPEIAWMAEPGTDVPLLVVSTSTKLNAYRVSQ